MNRLVCDTRREVQRGWKRVTASFVLLTALGVSTFAQDSFVAIPPDQAANYQLNFARNFFASAELEKLDRKNLYHTLELLEQLKGKVTSSAVSLERALELNDLLLVQFNRHYSYLYLRNATHTDDEFSLAEASALDAEVAKRTAFLKQELMSLTPRLLSRLGASAGVKPYLFSIERARRYRPYTLSLKEEELLNATASNTDWAYELYEKLRTRTAFKPISSDADARTREQIFRQNYAALASERELYAFTLTRLAAARTRTAELRDFSDAASETYFNSYWTRAEVDALISQVASQANVYKRYQQVRAERIQKLVGGSEENVWDNLVRPPQMRAPRFTIAEASQTIKDALAPLGREYGDELAALLDPRNGRMDIVPGAHRKRGGFSKGFVGTDSVFYSGGFAGSYNDLRILAHESTHAVHRQLMSRAHVRATYAEGPHYLFEAFAIFNEFLLPDYLYQHESDLNLKTFYLEQFLEGKGTVMFVAAPEVELERAVYDGVKRQTIRGADDLDALTKKIYSRYSIWPSKHDELKMQWMNVGLMYEDPFYDINYVYGALLALNFYELYSRDPAKFVPRYLALMQHGFDETPDIQLKKFLDIDLRDPKLVANAVRVVDSKIRLLETLYAR
jgi:oligoendopeptidase F